jgi:hypothetical protein
MRRTFGGLLVAVLLACGDRPGIPPEPPDTGADVPGAGTPTPDVSGAEAPPPDVPSAETPPPSFPSTLPPLGPVLWFRPADMTSSYAGTLRVELQNGGTPVEASLLEALRDSVFLWDLATHSPIPFSVTAHNTSPWEIPQDGVPQDPPLEEDWWIHQVAYVEVTPDEPLGTAWYVLGVSQVPDGVRIPTSFRAIDSSGALGIRMSPASRPVIREIEVCHPTGAEPSAFISVSEPVAFAGLYVDDVVRLHLISDDAARCLNAPGIPLDTGTRAVIQQTCAGMSTSEPWTLDVMPELASVSGVPVQTVDGGQFEPIRVDYGALPQSQLVCRAWRP